MESIAGLRHAQTLVERLEKLEARFRWWKRAGLFTLAVAGVGLLMASARHETARTVEAQRFILRDATGRARADLRLTDAGPSLELLDTRGQPRIRLALAEDGTPRLSLHDATGTPRGTLSVGSDGQSRLELVDRDGKPRPAAVRSAGAPMRPAASAEATKRREQAQGLYNRLCARCHLADGSGSSGRGKGRVPDFTSPAWQRSRSDAQLLDSILNGLGTRMPAYGDRLSTAQARDLVVLVRNFSPDAVPAAAGGDSFERRWRQLEERWQELERQLEKLHQR